MVRSHDGQNFSRTIRTRQAPRRGGYGPGLSRRARPISTARSSSSVMHDHIAADPKFRERFLRRETLLGRPASSIHTSSPLPTLSLNDPAGPAHRHGSCTPKGAPSTSSSIATVVDSARSPVSRILSQAVRAALQARPTPRGSSIVILKPANLMIVDPDTPYEKIGVMDFLVSPEIFGDDHGVAGACTTSRPRPEPTSRSARWATSRPGTGARRKRSAIAADLYSVGVILYELLSGKLPFHREETMDVLIAHATEPPPPFDQNGLPPEHDPGRGRARGRGSAVSPRTRASGRPRRA